MEEALAALNPRSFSEERAALVAQNRIIGVQCSLPWKWMMFRLPSRSFTERAGRTAAGLSDGQKLEALWVISVAVPAAKLDDTLK